MKTNRFWPVLLGGVFVLCVACALLLPRLVSPGLQVQVMQHGQVLYTLSLDEEQSLTIAAPNGGSNTVTVDNGQVCVSHATCPDQVCVNQGWVNTDAVPIVCLPNQLVIQVKGGEQDLDAAAG